MHTTTIDANEYVKRVLYERAIVKYISSVDKLFGTTFEHFVFITYED
jgi:hypothetical protein